MKKDIKIVIIIFIIVILFFALLLIKLQEGQDKIRERCQSKGWDDFGYDDGEYICINIPQAELDAREDKGGN